MTGPDIRDRRVVRGIVLGCCLTMLATYALAQPTPEQQATIRNACRADFMTKCAGVTPGGAEALACLQTNAPKLSSDCQSALNAIASPGAAAPPSAAAGPPEPAAPAPAAAAPAAPPPAAAVPRPTSRQQAAIRSACRSDFMTNCAGVPPGGLEALACLQRNAGNLSPACQRAVAAIAGAGGARAARAPAGAGAPPAAAPPPMPPLPPIAELMIYRRCRVDISTICPLPPGGGRIIECLVANTPSLTPRCQGALAEARAMVR